uniref:Large ribosomal subunit protein uL13c n=1 Tax=Fagus sylvatica TaxID=28930 RepID=A0A2N9FTY3_FAGSY
MEKINHRPRHNPRNPKGLKDPIPQSTSNMAMEKEMLNSLPIATTHTAPAGYRDIWNRTWYPKAADHVNTDKTWYVVDATDKILGRLASTIAIYIRGKNLATYTPSVDMGAFVIVVNAEKVAVSGKKRTQKLYRRHSGRPGGMTVETFDQLQQRIPERIIEHAVRGMLPKGRLGRALFNHLKVYKGPDHPHEAQKPVDLPIRDKRIQKER